MDKWLHSPDKLGYGKCTFEAQSDKSKDMDVYFGMAKNQEHNGLTNTGGGGVMNINPRVGVTWRRVNQHESTEKFNILCIEGPLPKEKWSLGRPECFRTLFRSK